jgi:ketosteroid isomerase-like protein
MLRKRTNLDFARLSLAALLLCAIAVPAFAFKGDVPHRKRKDVYKEQVEQLEQSWRTAQLANDIPAMDKLLSDDYVGITMTGQVVTKLQQLERMRNRQLVLTRIDMDDVKIKLIGPTAVVTSLINIDGSMEGQNIHGTYRYTRVYSRQTSGAWKITNFEATRVGSPEGPMPGGHHRHNQDPSRPNPDQPRPGQTPSAPNQDPPNPE